MTPYDLPSHPEQVSDHIDALLSGHPPYDLFVIGGGSGGVRAARWAAARGLRVGIAEGARYGGTCVNLGCVPKKLFFHASECSEMMRDASGFGWSLTAPPKHDWSTLVKNIDAHVTRLNGIYERLLDQPGVERFQGWATFVDEHHLRIECPDVSDGRGSTSTLIEAHHILIATGGRPIMPSLPGIELAMTSDDFFGLTERPQSALVVGGGYIGVELAGVLSGLGVSTTLALRGDLPLRGFDSDLRSRLGRALRDQCEVRVGVTPSRIERLDAQMKRVFFTDERSPLDVELVLFATGRSPNSRALNLEVTGVELTEQGAVIVDDEYRTAIPHIFAVGDVIDKLQLTPVALAEAMRVVGVLCGEPLAPLDYDLVPTTVFSHPNIGTVGLSEDAARSRGHSILIYEADFRPMQQAFSAHPRRVYMKIVVDQSTDVVLGCHMIGADAGEQIQGLAAAMQASITKSQLDQTIGIHPTMAEEWVTMRTPRVDR